MTNLVNLDRSIHGNLKVVEEQAFSVWKDLTMCPVTLNEIARLVVEYPMAFAREGNAGAYVCVALFGVSPDKNLYWQNGRWTSYMVPLNVGRQPFFATFAGSQDGTEQQALTCIDIENPGVQSINGERLFDDNGEYSPYLRHKMTLLAELIAGEQRTRLFAQRAAELDLITPIQLELRMPGAEAQKFSGLHTIDERKLRSLDAAVVSELNVNGYLHAMHAMISSLAHLQILARRAWSMTQAQG